MHGCSLGYIYIHIPHPVTVADEGLVRDSLLKMYINIFHVILLVTIASWAGRVFYQGIVGMIFLFEDVWSKQKWTESYGNL